MCRGLVSILTATQLRRDRTCWLSQYCLAPNLSLCVSRFSVSLCACLRLPLLCLCVSVSTRAPNTAPAAFVPSDCSLTCLGAQHITCKPTVTHEQLNTAPFVCPRSEKRRIFGPLSERPEPQHATAPTAPTELPRVTSRRGHGWRQEPPVERSEPICDKPG